MKVGEGVEFEVEIALKHLRNVFARRYPELAENTFPAAFLETSEGKLMELISAGEMNAAKSLEDLKELVSKKVSSLPR